MVNYQLYRSNVLLGGQMKWDIVIGNSNGNLVVRDFHLSPISRRVPHNALNDENLIRYPHQSNVKKYYRGIKDSFFQEYGNKKLEGIYPLTEELGYGEKTHDDTFEMGCRRMSYKLYGTQFEFFCPVWLEHLSNSDTLSFEFAIKSKPDENGEQITLYKKEFSLDTKDNNTYHNQFIEYFKNYLEYSGVATGNESVIYANLKTGESNVSGLNVSTGLNQTKKLSLVDNILNIEKPLLETDNIITRSLSDNNIICHQLFNFNICFNLDDVLTDFYKKEFGHHGILISMNVKINDEYIDLVDFYSNYEYIPRKFCGPVKKLNKDGEFEDLYESFKGSEQLNVLSYLKDYKCIDLIDKNKIIQSIIHWSLIDENEYIFNVYPGFAGYYLEPVTETTTDENGNTTTTDVSYIIRDINARYDETPDPNVANYSQIANNAGWCNTIELDKELNSDHLLTFLEDIQSSSYRSVFKNGIRVKHLKCKNFGTEEYKIILLTGGEESVVTSALDKMFSDRKTDESQSLIIAKYGGHNFIIYSQDVANLTFSNVLEHISDEILLVGLKSLALDKQSAVSCIKSLDMELAESPSLSTSEISFYKTDLPGQVLLRESGAIKPTFVLKENDINYNYRYSKQELGTGLSRYLKSGYAPLYPSAGYFFIGKNSENYSELRSEYEYNSFNINKIVNLIPSKEVILNSLINESNGKYSTIKELMESHICSLYNINITDDSVIKYIMSLYEYSSSFDYKYVDSDDLQSIPEYHVAPTNEVGGVFKYEYKIQMRLK